MAKSALDEASAHWGSLVPAWPGLCWGWWWQPHFKGCGVEYGGKRGPSAGRCCVRGGTELRGQVARQGQSMQPDGTGLSEASDPEEVEGCWAAGLRRSSRDAWAGAVALGKGKKHGQRASRRKLLGRGGRAERSMLPFLAGPGLGSKRRGSDWGQRPIRPASHGPLSLLYALRLNLAPPLPCL